MRLTVLGVKYAFSHAQTVEMVFIIVEVWEFSVVEFNPLVPTAGVPLVSLTSYVLNLIHVSSVSSIYCSSSLDGEILIINFIAGCKV